MQPFRYKGCIFIYTHYIGRNFQYFIGKMKLFYKFI